MQYIFHILTPTLVYIQYSHKLNSKKMFFYLTRNHNH